MKGMIFAAGLGTRLAPLTLTKPKALVEVGGQPMLQRAMDHFAAEGCTEMVVNVHHFAQQVIDYIEEHRSRWPQMVVHISDESDALLDTGGGLVRAVSLFETEGPIVVGNADVVCDAPLRLFVEQHKQKGREASLLTKVRPSTRQLLFDGDGRLSGWVNKTTGETKTPRSIEGTHESAFCGFHVVEPSLLKAMPQSGKFPIIDAYLSLAADHVIGEEVLSAECHWFDVGTTEKLAAVEQYMAQTER